MATIMTNLQQIRNKRLAKLGSQASSWSSPNTHNTESAVAASQPAQKPSNGVTASESAEQPKPAIIIAQPPSASKSAQNPFSQLAWKQTTSETPRINISSTGKAQATPLKRERSISTGGKLSSRGGETLESWEDRTLGAIFRLTLDDNTRQDVHGHNLQYVGSVKEDLEEQGEPIRFSTAVLDQAILDAASSLGKTTPLDYLLACWKRVSRQFRGFKAGRSEDPKFAIIKEARRLCMSYCMFAVTMPDMFG